MPPKRLQSKKELLEFVVDMHTRYSKLFDGTHSEFVSRYYLKDFLRDIVVIQHYASKKDDNAS